jgi:DNA-directed RNA polymerase specialized sigma24 family protein
LPSSKNWPILFWAKEIIVLDTAADQEHNVIEVTGGDGMDELIKYLRALVYLQARQLSGEATAIKTEILLANAGLSYREISDMTGKSEPAIAKAVSRERLSNKKAKNQ